MAIEMSYMDVYIFEQNDYLIFLPFILRTYIR